jgi:cellulose synthase operon protein C
VSAGTPEALVLSAQVELAQGHVEQAITLVRAYAHPLTSRSSEGTARLQTAAASLEGLSRQHPAASEKLKAATEEMYRQLAAGSSNADGPLSLARYLARQGKLAEALAICEQGVARWPEEGAAAAVGLLSDADASPADYQRAEHLVTALQSREPRERLFTVLRADLHQRQQQYSEAEALYRGLLKDDPRNVPALNNLAYLLALRGTHLTEADDLINRAIQRAGTAAPFLDTRALVRLAAGNVDQAIQDLKEAVGSAPTVDHYLHLSQAYLQAGRREDAEAFFQRAEAAGLHLRRLTPLEQNACAKVVAEFAKQ